MIGMILGNLAASGGDGNSWAAWDGGADGSATTISSHADNSAYVSAAIDANNSIEVFHDNITSTLHCVVSGISGNVISSGSIQDIENSAGSSLLCLSICMLDATRAVVAWADSSASALKAVVVTIDAVLQTITPGTVKVINSTNVITLANVVLLDANTLFFAYKIAGSGGNSCVTTVSGTTIATPGVNFQFESGTINTGSFIGLDKLTTSTVIVVYGIGSTASGVVLSVSGTTITKPTAKRTLNATALNTTGSGCYLGVVALSSIKAVCCYRIATSGYLVGTPLDISGTVIAVATEGAVYSVNSVLPNNQSVIKLNATEVLVSFLDIVTTYFRAIVVNVSSIVTPSAAVTISTLNNDTGKLIAGVATVDSDTVVTFSNTAAGIAKAKILKRA